MKKFVSFFVTVVAAVVLPIQVMGQVSLTGNASATIVTTTSIVDDGSGTGSTLNFGALGISSSAGTCTVSTTAARTVTGGVSLVNTTTLGRNALFGITGLAGAAYVITLPGSATVTRNGGSEIMTIGNFTARPTSAAVDQTTGTFDASTGKDQFTVGGTLNVSVSQAEGVYTGTFNVSVAYN